MATIIEDELSARLVRVMCRRLGLDPGQLTNLYGTVDEHGELVVFEGKVKVEDGFLNSCLAEARREPPVQPELFRDYGSRTGKVECAICHDKGYEGGRWQEPHRRGHAQCPTCGKWQYLRKDGTARIHRNCPGILLGRGCAP